MEQHPSRRALLLAGVAAAGAMGSASVSITQRGIMVRYEDRLAAGFDPERANLSLMAMAHVGGFAERIQEWLGSAQAKADPRSFFNAQALRRIFDALLTGDVEMIEASLRHHDIRRLDVELSFNLERAADPSSAAWLDHALSLVVNPLILLGRGDLLPSLHERSLRRFGAVAVSNLTVPAALALGEADEWTYALKILEPARRAKAGIPIGLADERLLWRYAYLYGRVDTVMPLLAEMAFSPKLGHLVAYRKWQLKTYRLRAGQDRDRIPIIEGEQPMGYDEAAAMQIAALADDPSAADYIQTLRRVVRPTTINVIHADRGVAFSATNVPQVFSTAEAMIAARRADHARAAALARMPSDNIMVDPANIVIDAFLDERDWRGAAAIAQEHDPRRGRVIAGFDDTRARDYVELYIHLAIAAAREGDDAAATEFLANAKAVDRAEVPKEDGRTTEDAFSWIDTLLAGLAEGLLPRKYVHVLTSAFRFAY